MSDISGSGDEVVVEHLGVDPRRQDHRRARPSSTIWARTGLDTVELVMAFEEEFRDPRSPTMLPKHPDLWRCSEVHHRAS